MEIDFTIQGKAPRIVRDRECFSVPLPWCIRGPGSAEFLGDDGWHHCGTYSAVKGFATKEEAFAYALDKSDGQAGLFDRLSMGAKTGPKLPEASITHDELMKWAANNCSQLKQPTAAKLLELVNTIRAELYPSIYSTIVGAIK
jgi:hypothetical protein